MIDDLRFFAAPLTSSQTAALAQQPAQMPVNATLLFEYRFNEAAGAVLLNSAPLSASLASAAGVAGASDIRLVTDVKAMLLPLTNTNRLSVYSNNSGGAGGQHTCAWRACARPQGGVVYLPPSAVRAIGQSSFSFVLRYEQPNICPVQWRRIRSI